MPRGSADGAQVYELELYAAVSPMEFLTRKRLDGECSYTWRSVLSGSHVGCEQRLERGWLSAAGGSDHWLKVVLNAALLYSATGPANEQYFAAFFCSGVCVHARN